MKSHNYHTFIKVFLPRRNHLLMPELHENTIYKLAKTRLGRQILLLRGIPLPPDQATSPDIRKDHRPCVEIGDTVQIKWLSHPDPDMIGRFREISIDNSPLTQSIVGIMFSILNVKWLNHTKVTANQKMISIVAEL